MCSYSVYLPLKHTHACTQVAPIPAGRFGLEARFRVEACQGSSASWFIYHEKGFLAVTPPPSHSSPQIKYFKALWLKLSTGFISNTDVAVNWLAQWCVLFPSCFEPGWPASISQEGVMARSLQGWIDLLMSPGLRQVMWLPGGYSDLHWKCRQIPLIHGSHVRGIWCHSGQPHLGFPSKELT